MPSCDSPLLPAMSTRDGATATLEWLSVSSEQVLEDLPSLVDVPVPEGTHINVCGDTHGQARHLQ